MKKLIFIITLSLFSYYSFAQGSSESFRMILKDNWQMQSTQKDHTPAGTVSTDRFDPKGWYKVSVPSTIIAGLLTNKVYDFDPFYGTNLKKLEDPALDHPWWFRKVFELPASEKGKNVVLKLHGINYKANVWLNGVMIADSIRIKGPFRVIELDVTKQIKSSGNNVLALEILRPFD
ncbi:MAG TPA: hypothetical protein VGM63_02130, partial [Mucilaginibacter sp.]